MKPTAAQVIATSRTDYSREAEEIKATFFSDADDFVEEVSGLSRHPLALFRIAHTLT